MPNVASIFEFWWLSQGTSTYRPPTHDRFVWDSDQFVWSGSSDDFQWQ